ncbi:MAG: helix-turn-helix domain-containing protein [Pontixanthobacter sp.]
MNSLSPLDALKLAIERAGSQARLADPCGVSQPSVWKWLHQQKQVAAEYVLKVESATGVSRHDLRPDLYPREDASPAAIHSDGSSGNYHEGLRA